MEKCARKKLAYSSIREKALWIDKFVDLYRASCKRKTFPRKIVRDLLKLIFPESKHLGGGAFKQSYYVSAPRRDLVLKVGRARDIERDMMTYMRLPASIRNRVFAKIYWCTSYTMLQKFGVRGRVPVSVIRRLKRLGTKYGVGDLSPRNIMKFGKSYKIVDAFPVTPRRVEKRASWRLRS